MIEQKILLIDDDKTLLDLLSDHFRTSGWLVTTANNGEDGLQQALEEPPDLVVLDVMMPGMDGWQVCQRLREKSTVPVIMLTAKDQEVDKLRGFRLGVDDYVTKPFSFAELAARASAVRSRAKQQAPASNEIISGTLTINLPLRQIIKHGEVIELTPTEMRLLEVLVQHIGRPVPTERLLQDVWGIEYVGEPEHVKHYIWTLRKKLEEDPGNPKHILTERGFGYRFK